MSALFLQILVSNHETGKAGCERSVIKIYQVTKFCQYSNPCWNFFSTRPSFQLINSFYSWPVHPTPTCSMYNSEVPVLSWYPLKCNLIPIRSNRCIRYVEDLGPKGARMLCKELSKTTRPRFQYFLLLPCMLTSFAQPSSSFRNIIVSASVVSTLKRNSSVVGVVL